jgi:hypothetical protein
MQYVVVKEKRVQNLVMLRINLQVVSRPGVLFSDCNATRTDSIRSSSPKIVRFDVIQKQDQFEVAPELKKFFQAEVLVPSPIPPHLIAFPEMTTSSRTVEMHAASTSNILYQKRSVTPKIDPLTDADFLKVMNDIYPEVSRLTYTPPLYQCRYVNRKWLCECGSPLCVPAYTGCTSSGPTGLTPQRTPERRATNEAGVSGEANFSEMAISRRDKKLNGTNCSRVVNFNDVKMCGLNDETMKLSGRNFSLKVNSSEVKMSAHGAEILKLSNINVETSDFAAIAHGALITSSMAVSSVGTSGRTGVADSVATESVSSRFSEVCTLVPQSVGGLTGGCAQAGSAYKVSPRTQEACSGNKLLALFLFLTLADCS